VLSSVKIDKSLNEYGFPDSYTQYWMDKKIASIGLICLKEP
jgi:hypothetical protein